FPIPPISHHHPLALPERNLRLTAIADMRPYRWATGLDRKAALESKYRATLLEFETTQAADEICAHSVDWAGCERGLCMERGRSRKRVRAGRLLSKARARR